MSKRIRKCYYKKIVNNVINSQKSPPSLNHISVFLSYEACPYVYSINPSPFILVLLDTHKHTIQLAYHRSTNHSPAFSISAPNQPIRTLPFQLAVARTNESGGNSISQRENWMKWVSPGRCWPITEFNFLIGEIFNYVGVSPNTEEM